MDIILEQNSKLLNNIMQTQIQVLKVKQNFAE